jgi:putative SOS response-associated peptidase YedK
MVSRWLRMTGDTRTGTLIAWLAKVESDPATLLRPAGEDVLKVWPVSKQNNGAELSEPIE